MNNGGPDACGPSPSSAVVDQHIALQNLIVTPWISRQCNILEVKRMSLSTARRLRVSRGSDPYYRFLKLHRTDLVVIAARGTEQLPT